MAGWMIQNIQDYTKMCPNGTAILKDNIKRRFPKDDTWVTWDSPRAYEWSVSVAELIQEIVQRHAEGIIFREYNVSGAPIRMMWVLINLSGR
jgi:glycogen debranching enzyme